MAASQRAPADEQERWNRTANAAAAQLRQAVLASGLAARSQRCLPPANIGVAAHERGLEHKAGTARTVQKRPQNHKRDARKADVGGGGGDGQQRRSLLRRDGGKKQGARPAHGGHLPLASSLPGQPVDRVADHSTNVFLVDIGGGIDICRQRGVTRVCRCDSRATNIKPHQCLHLLCPGLCLSLHWVLPFLVCLFALSACACPLKLRSLRNRTLRRCRFAVFQYKPTLSCGDPALSKRRLPSSRKTATPASTWSRE